jgi:hypothetical protein
MGKAVSQLGAAFSMMFGEDCLTNPECTSEMDEPALATDMVGYTLQRLRMLQAELPCEQRTTALGHFTEQRTMSIADFISVFNEVANTLDGFIKLKFAVWEVRDHIETVPLKSRSTQNDFLTRAKNTICGHVETPDVDFYEQACAICCLDLQKSGLDGKPHPVFDRKICEPCHEELFAEAGDRQKDRDGYDLQCVFCRHPEPTTVPCDYADCYSVTCLSCLICHGKNASSELFDSIRSADTSDGAAAASDDKPYHCWLHQNIEAAAAEAAVVRPFCSVPPQLNADWERHVPRAMTNPCIRDEMYEDGDRAAAEDVYSSDDPSDEDATGSGDESEDNLDPARQPRSRVRCLSAAATPRGTSRVPEPMSQGILDARRNPKYVQYSILALFELSVSNQLWLPLLTDDLRLPLKKVELAQGGSSHSACFRSLLYRESL